MWVLYPPISRPRVSLFVRLPIHSCVCVRVFYSIFFCFFIRRDIPRMCHEFACFSHTSARARAICAICFFFKATERILRLLGTCCFRSVCMFAVHCHEPLVGFSRCLTFFLLSSGRPSVAILYIYMLHIYCSFFLHFIIFLYMLFLDILSLKRNTDCMRLGTDAWSIVKWLRQGAKKYPHPRRNFFPHFLCMFFHCLHFPCFSRPPCVMKTWDQDGEFLSRKGEHILVSRLLTAVQNDKAKCVSPPHATELLQDLYALQVISSRSFQRAMVAVCNSCFFLCVYVCARAYCMCFTLTWCSTQISRVRSVRVVGRFLCVRVFVCYFPRLLK